MDWLAIDIVGLSLIAANVGDLGSREGCCLSGWCVSGVRRVRRIALLYPVRKTILFTANYRQCLETHSVDEGVMRPIHRADIDRRH